MANNNDIVIKCRLILKAYSDGSLGDTTMPEDCAPEFENDIESRLAFFTLPMALNYQRNSTVLWQSALQTWEDNETRDVFNLVAISKMSEEELRDKLTKHKLALQPNKHINSWSRIAHTMYETWGSFEEFLNAMDNDYIKLRDCIQGNMKSGFPYLAGPKLFNYWCYVLMRYCGIQLKNSELVEIALDSHVTRCSVVLGVITQDEAKYLPKEAIYAKWREVLEGSGINPIDLHSPLWFWSRNGFLLKV